MVSVLLAGMLSACGANSTATPVTEPTATTAAVVEATATTAMAAETPTVAATTAATMAATAMPEGTSVVSPTAKPPAPTITPFPTVPQPSGSTKITFWYGLTGFNGGVVQQVVNK